MVASAEGYALLIERLKSSWLKAHGVSVQRTLTGSVALSRAGQSIGVLWFENKTYYFARTGYMTSERSAGSAAAATAITLALVVRNSGSDTLL